MAAALAMPKLGMTMTEGRVVSWPIAIGARVGKGETVLIIESEKAEVEIEAPASGVLRHVYVEPDTTVPCGALLAAITEDADEAFDAEEFRRRHDRPEASPARPAAKQAAPAAGGAARPARGAVTPAARALARQLGIDVEVAAGTGPGGRVTREDVEALAERRKALVEVAPGVSLEVPAQGEGDLVLLLPGFGTDVSSFAPQIAALSEGYRVVGVNPRGVGLSDAPDADAYEVARAAADAVAAIDRPAHVVGASLGAAAALEMALADPQRVRSLTLITPFLCASPRLLAVLDAWCDVAAVADAMTLAKFLLPWLFSRRTLADAASSQRIARGLATTVSRVPHATIVRSAAGLRAWSGTRRGQLAAIGVPCLVLAGGEDLLTPDAREVATAVPGAAYVEVPDSGHALAIEAGEAVNEAVAKHLRASCS